MTMTTSLVALAASEYTKANYSAALKIYKKLSKIIGANFFEANIQLCERRISTLVGLQSTFRIQADANVIAFFVGSEAGHELDVLLESCLKLVKMGEKIRVLLVWGEATLTLGKKSAWFESGEGARALESWLAQIVWRSDANVADYYAIFDVLVVSKKPFQGSGDGYPIRAIDALAAGKRVVSPQVVRLPDATQLGEGVTTFEAGQVESLTRALRNSLNRPLPIIGPVVPVEKAADLIRTARKMIAQPASHIAKISGRIALVARRSPSELRMEFSKRARKWDEILTRNGYQTSNVYPEKFLENASTAIDEEESSLRGAWPNENPSQSMREDLENSVLFYLQKFREFRPQLVIATGDYRSALPAIVAAKNIGIPVIKEHLHYAEEFSNNKYDQIFSGMDFSEKYEMEKECFSLSERSYYLSPDENQSQETFLEIVHEVINKTSRNRPICVLRNKEFYSVSSGTTGGGLHYLELEIDDESSGEVKGIVASFEFYDDKNNKIKPSSSGFSSSRNYSSYQYIDSTKSEGAARVVVFLAPEGIAKISVDVVAHATKGPLKLLKVKLGAVVVHDISRWLSRRATGTQWIKAVESYVQKEGANSLRLALLNHKYVLSRHASDLSQLNGAIQEFVELDRDWLPTIGNDGQRISLRRTDKLTVVHLHKTAYPYENTGGAIRCLNTVISQKRLGIDPYIITSIGYPRSAGVLAAKNYELIEDIEHFRIGASTDGLRGISLPDRVSYSAFHTAKVLISRGASVIHAASGIRGYELALQALAVKKITGLPLLYEVRSFHEHTWTQVRDDVMALEKTQLRLTKENFCMAEADYVTTISESMKKILIERGVPREKIEVIPNAIDETKYLGKRFDRVKIPALLGADIVVGYISNMSLREGHEYLVRAIHKLRLSTGRDIRGLLVGNGPERERLEKLTIELGMRNMIIFSGEVDHSEINGYYKAIDLFVVPRIPDYAADWVTPLKPYEAMALELPLIVTDLPALKEIVGENEERGLLAKPADVDSLVLQLQRYMDDSAMREQKVRAAREWVFGERTWSANARRYAAIYRNLIFQNEIEKKEAQLA